MKNESFWKKFEKSGSVKDYLEYACTSCDDDYDMAVTEECAEELMAEEVEDAMEQYDDEDKIKIF